MCVHNTLAICCTLTSTSSVLRIALGHSESRLRSFAPFVADRYVPTAWHHATVNLGETVGLSLREQFLESAPSLEVAAAKWAARQRRGGPIKLPSRIAAPNGGGGKMDDLIAPGGVVFDLWLSDDEAIQAQREQEGLRSVERRLQAEAAMPSREQMIQDLEARRRKKSL